MRSARLRRPFVPVLGGLIAMTWVVLFLCGQSPYGRYLNHGGWMEAGPAGAICRAFPAGDVLLPIVLYGGGWLLMVTAMMLPTVLPLLDRFERLAQGRPDRRPLLGLVVAGYLVAWGGFAAVAHAADALLHAEALRSTWLLLNGWVVGAAVLAGAGLFQFSRLKYRCLAKCRTPYGFIVKHWRGPAPRRSAFALGLDHGVFCVGCCWAMMLLMFVVGTGNVGWMLALGGLMAIEKNTPWGARLSRPLGAALLVIAAAVAAVNLTA